MSVAEISEPDTVTVRAAAKVNLALHVGPPREDGFHPLATVYQAIGVYDDVTVAEDRDWSVTVEAPGGTDVTDVPLDASNIALRAGRLLTAHHDTDLRAAVRVVKDIPVAGGLAGGSADAAATLVALDRLWGLETSDDDLLALAARLGSDVPFALLGGTALGTGRGEVVEPVDDAGAWWWVVVPSARGLSTPAVYAAFDDRGDAHDEEGADLGSPDTLLAALAAGDHDALAAALRNDLTDAALSLRPDLAATRDALAVAGAVPLLSGSGPTWLGLCRDADDARAVVDGLHGTLPGARVLVAPGPVAGCHVVEYA